MAACPTFFAKAAAIQVVATQRLALWAGIGGDDSALVAQAEQAALAGGTGHGD